MVYKTQCKELYKINLSLLHELKSSVKLTFFFKMWWVEFKSSSGPNDRTPPKRSELSEYTDSAHSEVDDLSSTCMNGSDVHDLCGHDTRQVHPSYTACRRTANRPEHV